MQSLVRRSDGPVGGDADEPCRFPKLQECAHFHYERVQLCPLQISLQPRSADNSLHSHHKSSMDDSTDDDDWYTVQVTSDDECWLLQRNYDNFVKLDSQLHQCIYDRKVSQLPELTYRISINQIEGTLTVYLKRFCEIVDNSLNCGPILTWFQLDNKGHRLLVPNEECDSINTPAVAAAYSIKKYVSQARDELNLEVGDMISVIDMASPGESIWWRGKRGFQVGFFPQHCVHVIGEKLACLPNAPSALSANPIKPVLRKHGKLIAFFRSFILNRPSRRRLKQSGILKERVFGCDLGEHLLNSGHEIPMVLKCCAEFIENHGLVDGIYRLSGVTSNIQKLRHAFDEDRIPELYTEDILQDIHSVASLLKMYFRELPNPLCTYQLYRSFVRAIQYGNNVDRSDDNERLLRIRETVHKLPPPHYRTLEYLMRHLARVAKHGARTGMTTRNVAIVWAPNLLRCAELEVGGVAALQGVGVQAVVTEFLICYTDLIFCDNLPMELSASEEPSSPKKLRPKSLMISTPTRLLSLEEAQNKQHLLSKSDESSYIEVGGGPKNLPEKYHTVLDLPQGVRKRGVTKRSPLGWRSFFTKSRSNTHASITKTSRKASTPGITTENAITTTELSDIQRKLRPVKSAESLISGQSEPLVTDIDTLGPLYCLNKPPGHNRSVSHDSYFDTLQQNSNNNSEGSLLDLSEIQLNFELEESEMRIFSEDESLVSSPRIKDGATRKILQSKDDFNSNTNSLNPSPKKQARIVLSPESQSRKRSRLEDQLSDILYIDCSTPDNTIQTTAIIHSLPEKIVQTDETEPKNKSPRNSDEMASKLTETKLKNIEDKFNCFSVKNKNRNSLNLESSSQNVKANLPKSLTEVDIISKSLKLPDNTSSGIPSTNLSPQTPNYKRLIGETDSSETTTPNQLSPDFSLTESPTDISYTKLNRFSGDSHKFETSNDSDKHDDTMIVSNTYENITNDLGDMNLKKSPTSPTYENVLTTISITYSVNSPQKKAVDNIYEDVDIGATKVNSNEASQVTTKVTNVDELLANHMECPTEKTDNKNIIKNTPTSLDLRNTPIILYKSHSLNNSPIGSPAVTFGSVRAKSSSPVFTGDGQQASSPVNSVTSNDNANNSLTSSQPCSNNGILLSTNEKRKSDYNIDEDTVYQQVKYFRRSVHEINELLDKPFSVPDIVDVNPESIIMKSTDTENDDCVVENVDVNEDLSGVDLVQNLNKNIDTDKVKSTDASIIDICENKSDTDLDNIDNKSDRFDSLDVFENVDNVSDVNTKLDDQCVENIDVTIEDSANKECENEFNNYKNIETESTKEDTSIVSISTDVDESSKANIESRSSKKNKIRELALKFEASDDKCARDSLPPCLRARQAKLMKNNSRTRSLDENAFAKECKDGSSNYINSLNTNFAPSVFRRKSFDERWNFCINASGPKTLNQPKTLPNFAKVSLEFHSMHTADPIMAVDKKSDVQNISMSDVEVNKEKELQVEKGVVKKEMKDTETFSQPISDMLSSSSSNIHSECNANPQLNRERIEKYKEERRNFLREKYRSESFRTEKDQVLSRLKQKTKSKHEHEDEYFKGGQEGCDTNSKLNKNIDNPVNRKVEIDDVHETWMKSRTKSTSEDKVIIIENESLSERLNPIKNPEPKPHQHKKCFSTDIFSHNWNDGKLTTDITSPELRTNQRYNKSDMPVYSERDFCKKPTVKAASEQDESRNSRDVRQKSESESSDERRVSQIESLKLKYESDITKRGAEYKNVSDKGYVKKGVKKKEISDNIKIRGDQLRRKDYGKPDNLDLNTDRRHTFEGMSMRERELESEKSQRVSLESKLSFHSATKPEKHSPSYCIRDMTAMFESKSNKS